MKERKQIKKERSLTLEALIKYGDEILIPELKEVFVSKKEFDDFKDETTTNFDKLSKKLDILLVEKTVREYQEEKEKKLWAIVLRSLKDHSILTNRELEAISKLDLF